MKKEGFGYFHQPKAPATKPRVKRKDTLGDPYGLYEESYWDSVGRNKDGSVKKRSKSRGGRRPGAGRKQGAKDSYHRRRRAKVTTEVSDVSDEAKRNHSRSVDLGGSEGRDGQPGERV